VECRDSSVSIGSGPWWIDEPSTASSWGSSGSGGAGDFAGTTQVGQGHYVYACDDGRLVTFRRTATPS
jgi:hypothetical protein